MDRHKLLNRMEERFKIRFHELMGSKLASQHMHHELSKFRTSIELDFEKKRNEKKEEKEEKEEKPHYKNDCGRRYHAGTRQRDLQAQKGCEFRPLGVDSRREIPSP